MNTKKFIFLVSIGISIVIIPISLVNLYVNPWGVYGNSGHLILYNDRIAKSEHLLHLKQKGIVHDAYIIGPSTVMPFPVKFIQEKTDLETFNLGVFWSGIEEAWAWLNFIKQDLKKSPKLVFLGLETWNFNNSTDGPYLYEQYRRRLLNAHLLSNNLEDVHPLKTLISKSIDAISYQQFKESINAYRNITPHIQVSLLSSKSFNEFGECLNYLKEANASFIPDYINKMYENKNLKNNKSLQESFEKNLINPRHVRLYCPSNQPDPKKLIIFQKIANFCKDYNIKLITFLMPTHPYFRDLLEAKTAYREFSTILDNFLTAESLSNQNVEYFDLSDIKTFGGRVRGFHDRYHMDEDNSTRLLDYIFKNSP